MALTPLIRVFPDHIIFILREQGNFLLWSPKNSLFCFRSDEHMKITFLSSKGYNDPEFNHGDCIIIDSGSDLVIYDCGSEEHAKRVIEYMDQVGYDKAAFVLSHNDSDHFDGLPYLIDKGRIKCVYTLLLLKYKKELLNLIDDGRITDDSLTRKIAETYSNIYSLSGKVDLNDAFDCKNICTCIGIVGPDKDYALESVAKFLDNRQGDTKDGETIYNAICFQVKVDMSDGTYFLLCGDSAIAPLESNLKKCSRIQLPHHGKADSAEKIYEIKDKEHDNSIVYFVSDNTGNSNGGSDKLKSISYGRAVKNTLEGDINYSEAKRVGFYIPGRSLGGPNKI